MTQKNIVIVGAGVSGLTTALLLSERSEYAITIAAKYMPGDYDIAYASPWAGADYMPFSRPGTAAAEHDRLTWPALENLARNHLDAGIHFQQIEIQNRSKDAGTASAEWLAELLSPEPWFKDLIPEFHQIPKAELKPGIDSATKATSVCINTALYLPWLVSQCLKNGVVLKRSTFKHISDAAAPGVHHSGKVADLVINCTGLSSSTLGGVEDKALVPVRGQIVLVSNDSGCIHATSGTDDGSDEVMYIMTRAAGGGTVLGGCYQKGNWDSQIDPSLALRIMKRAVEICPKLTNGKGIEHLDVIRHAVGLRPVREGGVRIEKEKINGVWTVHNYGHGGFGYQASYGCSQAAIKLVDEVLTPKARL